MNHIDITVQLRYIRAMEQTQQIEIRPAISTTRQIRPRLPQPTRRFPDVTHRIHRCTNPDCLINNMMEW